MGRLTTHVLDTARGCPGKGIAIALHRIEGDVTGLVTTTVTNDDGRCDQPLLQGEALTTGTYELTFSVGAYFDAHPIDGAAPAVSPKFLDDVVIRFGIAHADEHYHVPLLISPFGYSTYRGS